jgi:cytokinesis protein
MLVLFVYIDGLPLVTGALEALSQANGGDTGCYDYWFKSFQASLSGRGKMGSLVGASEDVKKAGIDSSLNEYTVSISAMVENEVQH